MLILDIDDQNIMYEVASKGHPCYVLKLKFFNNMKVVN